MTTATERVYTVNSYYDGPELGVADYQGRPHVYERLTERHEENPDVYRLSPLAADALAAVLEDWQLFLKWDAAQDDCSRRTLDDGPRVLPRDLQRHQELRPLVEAALNVDEVRAVRVRGVFVDRMTSVEWKPL